jgi:hypothetical protein
MRTTRYVLALSLSALLLVACGGSGADTQQPAATQAAGGGGGGGGTATQNAPADTRQPAGTESGGGGGGNVDVATVAANLVPPHSTEITKTTATDTWFVMYETTDSIDSLKSFYTDAIAKAGLQIISTTTVNGGVSYVIATDDSATFGGAVNIYPSSDGKNAVQVTIGKT